MEERDEQIGVVFVHGFISSGTVWDSFVRLIKEDPELKFVVPFQFTYETKIWELDPRRRIPSFDTTAANLQEYLDNEAGGFERLVLVAHSQGGLVVQKYLHHMIGDRGQGRELSRRIRKVILFACPNDGTEFLSALRRAFFHSNPQENQLRPLNEQITNTRRFVINRVVHAQGVSESSCSIPIVVYAGETDSIVQPASALSVFRDVWVLPGDHFTIVQPNSRQHRVYKALKQQLQAAAADRGPPIVTEWKDLPDRPPSEMEGLLAAMESIETLPYHLSGSRSLSDVYVQQQLRDLDTISLGKGETGKWGPAQLVGSALDAHEHVVVVGGSGQGKSTLTLRLAAELSAAWRTPTRRDSAPTSVPVIPIRVPADALLARKDSETAAWMETLVNASNRELNLLQDVALPAELLTQRVNGAQWLVIVDGLDKIRDPVAQSHIVGVLAQRMRTPNAPYRLLITTQPLAFEHLHRLEEAGAGCFGLDGFESEGALEQFARRWFSKRGDEGRAQQFLQSIDVAGLREIVQIPLLAAAAAVLFDPDQQLPHNKHDLYDDFLSRLWQQQKLRESLRLLKERLNGISKGQTLARWIEKNLEALLLHLAVVTTRSNSPLIPAATDWINSKGPKVSRKPHEWRQLIAEMLISAGWLEHRGRDVQFLHETIAEHLTAKAAAEALPTNFQPSDLAWRDCIHRALGHTDPKFSRSVLIHHARVNETGDDLLLWLRGGNDRYQRLALELLAEGIPVQMTHLDWLLPLIRHWICWADDTASRGLPLLASLAEDPRIPALLESLAKDPTLGATFRIESAETLARAHPGMKARAATALKQIIDGPIVGPGTQATAAHVLAGLGSQYEEKVVATLRAAIAEGIDWYGKRLAVEALRPFVAQGHQDAAEVLFELACFQDVESGQARKDAAEALLPVIDQVRIDLWRWAAALIDLRYWSSAIAVLRQLTEITASNPHATPSARVHDGQTIGADPPEEESLPATVQELLNEAKKELAKEPSFSERRVTRALREAVGHPGVNADTLTKASELLEELKRLHPLQETPRRTQPMEFSVVYPSPEEKAQQRSDKITWLAQEIDKEIAASEFVAYPLELLDLAHRALDWRMPDDIAVKAFRYIAQLDGVDAEILLKSAKMWVDLGPTYYQEIATVLRLITSRQVADPYERTQAARVLALLDPAYVNEAAMTVRQASNASRATPFERYCAAVELACLGPQFADEAVAALRNVLLKLPEVQLMSAVIILLMHIQANPELRADVEAGLQLLQAYDGDREWWASMVLDYVRAKPA